MTPASILWSRQSECGLNAPLSSAAGRLFDSFAVMLGVSGRMATYDGQAAIRLEAAALKGKHTRSIPEIEFTLEERPDMLVVDWRPAFRELAAAKPVASAINPLALAVRQGWLNMPPARCRRERWCSRAACL